MPLVDVPEHGLVEFPDSMSGDQISAAIDDNFPDISPKFNTKLSQSEEKAFVDWKQQYAPNDSGADYDLRGAFKAGLTPGENGHWPDTFKKPNHPTFSDESIYAKDAPERAGHWFGDTFTPAPKTQNVPLDPYQKADLASMQRGQGKSVTGMESGTDLTAATLGIPFVTVPLKAVGAALGTVTKKVVRPVATEIFKDAFLNPPEEGESIISEEVFPYAAQDQKGVLPAASRIVRELTTPENLITLPLAVESKPVQAAFAAGAAAGIPGAAEELINAQTPEEKSDAATRLAFDTGMAALIGKGAIPKSKGRLLGEALANEVKGTEFTGVEPSAVQGGRAIQQKTPLEIKADEIAPFAPLTAEALKQTAPNTTTATIPEVQNATDSLRTDEGRISTQGDVVETSEVKGSEDLQQPTQAGAETGGPKVRQESEAAAEKQQQQLVGMGGAVPSEFEHSPKTPTSIKNAAVDAERAKRGLPPAVEPVRRTFGAVWDEAMATVDRDPSAQDRLINELHDNPRALTDLEDALLLHRQIDLQNEYGKATRELAQAFDDGRLDQLPDLKARVQYFSDQLLDIYNIGKKVGTETGRGLNARKMMANEDFSLANLEMQKRAANGGRPLTDVEHADLVKIADEYKAKSEALEKHVAEQQTKISEMEAARAIAEMKPEQPKVSSHVIAVAEKIVGHLEKRADDARTRLKEKFARTSAGIDPTILADLAEVGAAHIGRIGLDFAKWSEKMIGEFGEAARPYLEKAYAESQKLIDNVATKFSKHDAPKVAEKVKRQDVKAAGDAVGDAIKKKVDAGQPYDISGLVQKLARSFVELGIKDRNQLIDMVHEELKKYIPDISRRDAMDAISGYGKFKQLTKDQISVELRDLKGQMQQVGKLEDMQAGQAPKKTGVERRSPSDEERRLIKQVEEAKKKGGYTVTDPATQLRSALQSAKTRLTNIIADLEHEIATRTRIVKEKSASPTSPEIEALKKRRDELRAQRDEIFGKRGLTDEQRVKMAMNAVEKSIAEYERRIKENDLVPGKKTSKTPKTPELAAAMARRDALIEQLKELKSLDPVLRAEKERKALESQKKALEKTITEQERRIRENDLSAPPKQVNRPAHPELEVLKQKRDELNEKLAELRKGPGKSPEEVALQAYKTRTANRIADLEERLQEGNFQPKPKREFKMDQEALSLQYQVEQVKRRFNEGLIKDKMRNRNLAQKIGGTAVETMNTSRALMTSADVSAVLRQGGFIALGHPIRASQSIPAMLRAMRSKEGQFKVEQEIAARKNFPLYKKYKLFLSEHGQTLAQMEEAYMSRWAEKIPGVAGSQRAYTTFLNKLRADSFDIMVNSLSRDGEVTPVEYKAIANYINVATGRGNLGMKENALVGLNNVFFAPRYVASRFQLLAGQPLYGGSARTRALIAKDYARYLIGLGVIYGLAKMDGADVETDPKSSDFAKIRYGNTRVDPLSGIQQVTVLLSRLTSGETTNLKGKTTPIRGDIPFGGSNSAEVIGRFLRTKLAPVPGAVLNNITGENVVGQPVTAASTAQDLMTPMAMRDIYNAMQEQGVPRGTALSLLSLLGMGLQTYDEDERKKNK